MSGFLADGVVPLTQDVARVCASEWNAVGDTGQWWTGTERVAIAAEARRARACSTCDERKASLSPGRGTNGHEPTGVLNDVVVDTVHRITTDPGRLSRSWFDGVLASGLPAGAYVEAVGVISTVTVADTIAAGLAATPARLPDARPGEPDRLAPEAAEPGGAWVPILPPSAWTNEFAALAQAASDPMANIMLALSSVQSEHATLIRLMMRTYRHPEPELTKAQVEVIASTVSAFNDCFY